MAGTRASSANKGKGLSVVLHGMSERAAHGWVLLATEREREGLERGYEYRIKSREEEH